MTIVILEWKIWKRWKALLNIFKSIILTSVDVGELKLDYIPEEHNVTRMAVMLLNTFGELYCEGGSLTIYEDDLIKVIMNIEPATNGHLLVLPKEP